MVKATPLGFLTGAGVPPPVTDDGKVLAGTMAWETPFTQYLLPVRNAPPAGSRIALGEGVVGVTTFTPTVGATYTRPFFVAKTIDIQALSVEVVGPAAATAELGLIGWSLSGTPGVTYALGSVSTATAGIKTASGTAVTLTPGWYASTFKVTGAAGASFRAPTAPTAIAPDFTVTPGAPAPSWRTWRLKAVPTNIIMPPDSTVLADVLLNGGAGPPADPADGELYIDEAGRTLYVETVVGVQGIPLDVGYVPRRPSGTPPDYVVNKTATGAAWGPLAGGAGGSPFDSAEFRVPGMAPTGLDTVVLPGASGGMGLFEMPLQALLREVRVHASAGAGAATLALYPFNGSLGSVIYSQTVTLTAPETQVLPVSIALVPGVYAWVWTGAASLTLDAVKGSLPWATREQVHPVAMKF
uniref:Tail fiber protein n=1 Tax=Caulobacter phage BL57 TaxID=3348355 RepID=A0AB74UG26_9VIRU